MTSLPPPEAASAEPTLAEWLRLIAAASDDDFRALEMAAPPFAEYEAQSSAWSGHFLVPECDPHQQPNGPEWVAHAAREGELDLIRCRFESGGRTLVYVESFNFIALGVPFQRGAWSEPALRRAEASLRGGPGPGALRFATSAGLWSRPLPFLVTTPNAPPIRALTSRHGRADLVVTEEATWLLLYKIVEQLIGLRPDDGWFDDGTRAWIRGE